MNGIPEGCCAKGQIHTIDGKPQPDRGQCLPIKINDRQKNRDTRTNGYENDYLAIKLFKNGNAHITFKRLDIVDKMNGILARHYPGALPAPKI